MKDWSLHLADELHKPVTWKFKKKEKLNQMVLMESGLYILLRWENLVNRIGELSSY